MTSSQRWALGGTSENPRGDTSARGRTPCLVTIAANGSLSPDSCRSERMPMTAESGQKQPSVLVFDEQQRLAIQPMRYVKIYSFEQDQTASMRCRRRLSVRPILASVHSLRW